MAGEAPVEQFRATDGLVFSEKDVFLAHQKSLHTLRNKSDERFVVAPGHIGGERFEVASLERCDVLLLDTASQVLLEQLTDCRVFIGPTAGSVNLHDCVGCIITVCGATTVRCNDSKECIINCRVRRGPAITNCTAMHFGPCNGSYPQLAEHMRQAGLEGLLQGAIPDKWDDVDDFSSSSEEGGLGPPPHWHTIDPAWQPEAEEAASFAAGGGGDGEDPDPTTMPPPKPLSPVAVLTVAALLDRFDADLDGAWSYAELNAYQVRIRMMITLLACCDRRNPPRVPVLSCPTQAATGDTQRVADAAEMRSMMQLAGVPTDAEGRLRLAGLLELYTMQERKTAACRPPHPLLTRYI
jgi:hypothetical protein